MAYELWDVETRNIIETFESEVEALRAVRQFVALNTPAYPQALVLVFEGEDGDTTLIARGDALAARAQTE